MYSDGYCQCVTNTFTISPISTVVLTRRQLLATVGAAALGGCSAVGRPPSLAPVAPEIDWPLAGRGYGNTYAAPASAAPDLETLTARWQRSFSGALGPPTVVGNRAYLGVSGRTVAVDVTDGSVVWEHDDADGLPWPRPPAVGGGTVYTASSSLLGSADNQFTRLFALASDSGRVRWQRDLPPLRSVLPFRNTVVVATVSDLRVLDAATGATRVTYSTTGAFAPRNGRRKNSFRLAFDDGVAFVTTYGSTYPNRRRVVAIDLHRGTVRWRAPVYDDNTVSSLAVRDGLVFVGTGSKLHTFDAETGSHVWRHEGFGYSVLSLVVGTETVFAAPDGEHILALDRATGEERWRAVTTGHELSLAGDVLYVPSRSDGRDGLLALDARTGSTRRRFDSSAAPEFHAVAAGDRLFTVAHADGSRLTCYA